MRIEAVDFFYLSMPEVTIEADGSQDALARPGRGGRACRLGRVRGLAARLHRRLRLPDVARRLPARSARRCSARRSTDRPTSPAWRRAVEYDSMDLLQAAHTWSGVEMALWDLLGKRARRAGLAAARLRRVAPEDALRLAAVRRHAAGDAGARPRGRAPEGFRAAKFGWGPFGRGTRRGRRRPVRTPRARASAPTASCWSMPARSSARTSRPPPRACRRSRQAGALWLEEPFHAGALEAYGALAARSGQVQARRRRGARTTSHMARHLIDYGRVGFIQIDCGRIGGIGPAKRVADYAVATGVTYREPHLHLASRAQRLAAALSPGWQGTRSANTRPHRNSLHST